MPPSVVEFGADARAEFLSPLIIAEIGVNHEGSLSRALRMIDAVAEAGGHVAKFQTYKAEKLAVRDSPAYWDLASESATSQYELFKRHDSFGADEYRQLASHCRARGIQFMSTPFDLQAVDELDPLMDVFKIASADLTNVPLLRRIARTRKPVILSTGASSREEIASAVERLHAGGTGQVVLLHCVLNYPTEEADAQLRMIAELQRWFPELAVGYSDHVPVAADGGLPQLELATLLGALVIEKHFTDDKTAPGNDHYHAMDASDLKRFRAKLASWRSLYGTGAGDRNLEREASARRYARRSIVAARNIRAGERFSAESLTTKRPATGIGAQHWDEILMATAARDIQSDSILQWEDVAS